MYTSKDQTVNLIELGFKKPKGWYINGETNNIRLYVNKDENPMMFNYSIGELIEILNNQSIEIKNFGYWIVDHEWHTSTKDELIDALYDTIITLKEKGKL